jgi:CheY-like chemotaxis protein
VHFAVKIALEEQLRRKARLRRKRMRPAPAQTAPAEPPLAVADKYRASFSLLGKDGVRCLQKWKARGHCSYDEVAALLPPHRSLSASELEGVTGMLRSLAIELRGTPAPRASHPPLLDRKRILLVHPDAGILCWIANALEEEGAEVVVPKLNFDDVLARAGRFAPDGAVLNFISDRLPLLRLANRLHASKVPIVFYTAFDTRLVARATAHMNCTIVSNPGSSKSIVSALAALMSRRRQPQLRSFLDN